MQDARLGEAATDIVQDAARLLGAPGCGRRLPGLYWLLTRWLTQTLRARRRNPWACPFDYEFVSIVPKRHG